MAFDHAKFRDEREKPVKRLEKEKMHLNINVEYMY